MKAKLVFESLNELSSFNQKKDPLSSLGIGQKHFIIKWLKETEVESYIINDDFNIDVYGGVYCSLMHLIEFPSYIKFNTVSGYFSCSDNKLISLRGCPETINGNFYCGHNQLTTLKGCPKTIGNGRFYCQDNKIQFTKEDVLKYCEVDKNMIYV